MICIAPFMGMIGDKPVEFQPGDKISEVIAAELDLHNKPELAKKEKAIAAQTKDA